MNTESQKRYFPDCFPNVSSCETKETVNTVEKCESQKRYFPNCIPIVSQENEESSEEKRGEESDEDEYNGEDISPEYLRLIKTVLNVTHK